MRCWLLLTVLMLALDSIRGQAGEFNPSGGQTAPQDSPQPPPPPPSGFAVPTSPTDSGDMVWTHHTILDHDNKVELFWTPGMQDITFEVRAKTTGYIAVGFSPTGGMQHSDMMVAWVVNGVPTLQDRWAAGTIEPEIDIKQDYTLIRGSEDNGHTIIRFSRKYDTCDDQDLKITNETMKVTFGYNDADPVGNTILVHQSAGHRSLILTGFNNVPQPNMPNTNLFEMRMPNVSLAKLEKRLCWRKMFKFTPSSPNSVVTGYQPLWRNQTAYAIDHIWLYKCDVTNMQQQAFDQLSTEKGYKCSDVNIPMEYGNCTRVIAAGAAGSLGYTMPAKVGYSFTQQNMPSAYFVVETSYRVWRSTEDMRDDSGIALIYSTEPAAYQVGTLAIGHFIGINQLVPLDQPAFISVGHCDSECTKKSLPADGIFIYEVLLKTHGLGRKITLRHMRNGSEMPPLALDDKYESRAQTFRVFVDPIHILPGDNLVMECSYDTTHAQSTTLGGLQDDNETCIAYANYFPQVDLQACTSSPPLAPLFAYLGTAQTVNIEPNSFKQLAPNYQDPKLVEFLKHYNWAGKANDFQNFVRKSYSSICQYNGVENMTVSDEINAPRIEHPYYELSPCGGTGTIADGNNGTMGGTGAPAPPFDPNHDHSMHDHGMQGGGQDQGMQGGNGGSDFNKDPMLGDHSGHQHGGDPSAPVDNAFPGDHNGTGHAGGDMASPSSQAKNADKSSAAQLVFSLSTMLMVVVVGLTSSQL